MAQFAKEHRVPEEPRSETYDAKTRKFVAGGLSGICEVTTSHPLDVVKTAMQDKADTKSKVRVSPYRYLLDRYRRGGIRHLYRGYLPRVMGIIPMRGLFWGVYGLSNEFLQDTNYSPTVRATIAGALAGTAQTLVDNPIEVWKTRMITSSHQTPSISGSYGFRGIYSHMSSLPGFYPTLCRNVGFLIVMSQFTSRYTGDSDLIRFGLGGTGGFMGSLLTQPIDYVKTQVQSANNKGRSGMQIFLDTLRWNPRALMVGAMPRASLGFLNMGVGYLAFSMFERFMI